MQLQIPSLVMYVLATLQTAGFEAYIVGGAVRDILLKSRGENHEAKDFDFTTNAKPEEIQALFPQSFYENTFGTVSITPEHICENLNLSITDIVSIEQSTEATIDQTKLISFDSIGKIHQSLSLPSHNNKPQTHSALNPFEITTFRSEGNYDDFRRPSEVTWGTSLTEDLQRRDFTVNALAIALDPKVLAEVTPTWIQKNGTNVPTLDANSYTIVDPFEGLSDLENNTIKTVGNPNERFAEDALRILRAIRFSVQLNMKVESKTYEAITEHRQKIQHVSWERIGAEVMKIMASDFPAEGIHMLDETLLLEYVIPELLESKGVKQGGHHTSDVWVHSLDALESCPSKDPVVRLATLLHDVGKPRTYKLINGSPTFYNHEIVGARMAKSIADRLRLSKHDIERVYLLVRQHMFYYQPENTDASIRRFMRNVGLENINDILDLREGDRLGSGARKTSWRLEEMKQRMIEQLHQPFAITDMAIDGTDLMNELDLKPGRIIGEILNYLFEKVMEEPELNSRDSLLSMARNYLAKN